MKKDPTIFLKHILESIEHIESYIKGSEEGDFMKSDEKQDAVIRRLEILGEAVRNLPEEFREKHSDIAWDRGLNLNYPVATFSSWTIQK